MPCHKTKEQTKMNQEKKKEAKQHHQQQRTHTNTYNVKQCKYLPENIDERCVINRHSTVNRLNAVHDVC